MGIYYPPIMENRMERNMENEMDTGDCQGNSLGPLKQGNHVGSTAMGLEFRVKVL